MKIETRLKKALETPDKKLRLLRLHTVCFKAIPHSQIWKNARIEIEKLENEGVKI